MGGGGGGFTANKRHLLALALISVLNNGTSKWQYGLRAGLGYESKKGTSTRAKRACVVCKKKTAYYCAGCSKPDQNLFVCLCNPANKSPEGYLSCVTTHHEGEPVA
jgi:hypothetical protein